MDGSSVLRVLCTPTCRQAQALGVVPSSSSVCLGHPEEQVESPSRPIHPLHDPVAASPSCETSYPAEGAGAGRVGLWGSTPCRKWPLCCAGRWWVSLCESSPSCPGALGSVPKASLFSGVQEPRQGGGAVLGVTPLFLLALSSFSCTKGGVQGGALASPDPSSILQPR